MNTASKQKQKEEIVRIPPSDLYAEQAVLGAILIDPNALSKCVEFVEAKSFYWKKHSIIFTALMGLHERNEPTDMVTVSSELKAKNLIDEIGGDFYLAELSEIVPFPGNVEYYAKIVQEKFTLRSLFSLSEDMGLKSFEHEAESSDILDWSIMELFNLQSRRERTGYQEINPITHKTMEDIERMLAREGALTGVGSGFSDLDLKMGGFQNSDLIIVAARPSMGKTALALCFGFNAAYYHKVPVGIISLEMSAKQSAMRMLSFESKVPIYKIRSGLMTKEEWRKLPDAASKLSALPLFLDDSPTQTITDVRARARRLKQQYDVGLIILDYLQLMQPPKNAENNQLAIAMITRQLKGLAKELDLPVIVISQLSRAVEQRGGSRRPILSDLRDSGAIEQDADVVLFIYRQAYYDRIDQKKRGEEVTVASDNTAEVIIGKQRNGPTGMVKLVFHEEYAQFVNIEKEQRELTAAQSKEEPTPESEEGIPF